jgi:pyruvate formate lyase activating enzyme
MHWIPADFFELAGDGILCTLCPHACELADGEVGFCQVRRRQGDRMQTATWATSVTHWGPIERKPLFHFRPGTQTLTIASPGCSFACHYCQNYRISQFGRVPEAEWSATPVEPQALIEQARMQRGAIALSYSEPSLAAELTEALAALARPAGVDVLWKTNGFVTLSAATRLARCLSAANVDLKAADDQRHLKLTTAPLQPVLEFIRRLIDEGVWVEVSTPLIPGVNADRDSLRRMADLITGISSDLPWHLLRFVPEFRMVNMRPTHPDELAAAVELARSSGVRFVYVERALGTAGRSTYCPGCGAELINRGVWSTVRVTLTAGACPMCQLPIPGRWTGAET